VNTFRNTIWNAFWNTYLGNVVSGNQTWNHPRNALWNAYCEPAYLLWFYHL
jgi:hypothetical protein